MNTQDNSTMAGLAGPFNSGEAAGSAGSATNDTDSPNPLEGRVLAIHLAYNDSPPGTTDVTIATSGTGSAPAVTLLTIENANTDGWFYPRHLAQSETGTDLDTGGDEKRIAVPIHDTINVKIEGADPGDSVDATFLLGEL